LPPAGRPEPLPLQRARADGRRSERQPARADPLRGVARPRTVPRRLGGIVLARGGRLAHGGGGVRVAPNRAARRHRARPLRHLPRQPPTAAGSPASTPPARLAAGTTTFG